MTLSMARYGLHYSRNHSRDLCYMSENTVKFLLQDLAELTNRIVFSSQHETLMNMVPIYGECYWSERISHNFVI